MKPSNPKDLAALTKAPLHLWPMTATALGASALYDGMRKYGYYNWRHDKVSIMTYVAALQRHMFRYIEGEEQDPDSKLPHLAHMLACLAILVDAQASNQLVDDRPIDGPDASTVLKGVAQLTEGLAEQHSDKHPRHRYRGAQDPETKSEWMNRDGEILGPIADDPAPVVNDPEAVERLAGCRMNRPRSTTRNPTLRVSGPKPARKESIKI